MKLVNLTCPNCGAPLEKIGDNLCCNACGGAFAIDYDDADVEHEKLQTEDERAAREFEHEKEMMEIKHRQLEESRIAAEKRENKRKSQERLGRAVKNKISGLITLVIIVGFFFGCYKLSVHWGIVPPMSEIIESAKQEAKDPYDFISAGFHEATFGKITIGNERGIATDREGDSGVTFGNIDFGENGSSRIQVSIFELASEPIDFEIYKGKREDGVCLGTFHYHKKSIWNTYQVEEYDLPEKLCGVQELTFVFHEKVHFKGFQFIKE